MFSNDLFASSRYSSRILLYMFYDTILYLFMLCEINNLSLSNYFSLGHE